MKLNKSNLFILIWVIHLFIYYLVFSFANRVSVNDYEELYTIFMGFTLGFMGWVEQIPLFFMIPLLLMLILIKTKLEQKWFIAYVVSICSSYLINYLWMFSNNKHNKILFSPDEINLIYFIIPSLIISIGCNWVIFRKKYTKLGV
ncbi:hypothetical protein ACSTS3_21865 [Aquimarina muelleri]|uniref:hypothetical protein n=1 Tax=Aquimarina muelleri TaxID=279356 RepID=UPI003F68725C